MTTRTVNVTYNYCGPTWSGLVAIASSIAGTYPVEQNEGETDEELLERVSGELQDSFRAEAGEATGADSFTFDASFSE